MQLRGIYTALLILTGLTATTAHAYVREDEPQPQERTFYLRGLIGVGYYNRVEGILERGWGMDYGAEFGATVLELSPSAEFNRIAIGAHFDHIGVTLESVTVSQNFLLGQVLFLQTHEWGAYFGPEFGMRTLMDENGGSAGSGMVAGLVAGVDVPLTTHLSYGPSFEVLYGFPADAGSDPNGVPFQDTAVIGKVYVTMSYHF